MPREPLVRPQVRTSLSRAGAWQTSRHIPWQAFVRLLLACELAGLGVRGRAAAPAPAVGATRPPQLGPIQFDPRLGQQPVQRVEPLALVQGHGDVGGAEGLGASVI